MAAKYVFIIVSMSMLALQMDCFQRRLTPRCVASPLRQQGATTLFAAARRSETLVRVQEQSRWPKVTMGGAIRRRAITLVGTLSLVVLAFSRAARAASGVAIRGFDLFGRMPYDDFLFSTSRLVDPNLLKRSFVEAVVQELPDVLGNFKKRKQLSEFSVIFSGLAYFFAGALFISVLYKSALAAGLKRGIAAGGKFSASAISKKGPRKGKQIEGMDDGWLDMELLADDEDSPDKKGGKPDDEEE